MVKLLNSWAARPSRLGNDSGGKALNPGCARAAPSLQAKLFSLSSWWKQLVIKTVAGGKINLHKRATTVS